VIWAAGVQASSLGRVLARETGAPLDKSGRIQVEPDLSLKGHPEIFVIGDLALYPHQTGQPLPGLAPVAMQEGKYVARLITRRLQGKPTEAFQYRDRGTMATVGWFRAVVDLRGLRFDGPIAWLTWLFVHLMMLVEFENRLLVLIQWAWHYFTLNRSARLITGETARLPAAGVGRSEEIAANDRSHTQAVPEPVGGRSELSGVRLRGNESSGLAP
jgi:NADH dehydrogenase